MILLSPLQFLLRESTKFRIALRLASFLQHPFADVWRTLQQRHACRLAGVQKTNSIDIHEINLAQVQGYSRSAALDLSPDLANVLRSKLPAQTNARVVLASNPLDLQRHRSHSEEQSNDCNHSTIGKLLQGSMLGLHAVLTVKEFLSNKENATV